MFAKGVSRTLRRAVVSRTGVRVFSTEGKGLGAGEIKTDMGYSIPTPYRYPSVFGEHEKEL
jgi:hypothetical protein